MLSEFAAQPLPEYEVVHRRRHAEAARRAALDGVLPLKGGELEVRLPMDWAADPHGSRTWRYRLHTLEFLDVLCQIHRDDDNLEALRMAVEVALDWVGQNSGEDSASEFAWYDMAVALRAPFIGYLLRAGAHEGVLSEQEAAALHDSALEHAAYLCDEANYAHGHNHGLFEDEGLLLLGAYLAADPEAGGWQATARRRALATIAATVDSGDAVHLEHSPGYHVAIVKMLRRLRSRDAELRAKLDDLFSRMEEAAGWLLSPNGLMPPVGDTDRTKPPKWLRSSGAATTGMRGFPGAGYGVVRQPDSYLLLSCGYHGSGHKHDDELSFVLEEEGVTVIADAGRHSYEEADPHRRHARSAWAHNGLLVDGEGSLWKGQEPYGSALEAVGQGEGWCAIVASNPLLTPRGVEHRRLLLYRPKELLVVVDRVTASGEHTYTRLFHFGPELSCEQADRGAAFEGPSVAGSLRDFSENGVEARLVRGQSEPRLQGWCYPDEREVVPSFALELESSGAEAILTAVLTLGAGEQRLLAATGSGSGWDLSLDSGDGPRAVEVRRNGSALEISEG